MELANRSHRIGLSSFVGFLFAALTWGALSYTAAPSWMEAILSKLFYLFLPGLIASMIVSGNFHGGSELGAAVGNFVAYSALTYFATTWWVNRSSRLQQHQK